MSTTVKLRRGVASLWASANPTLAQGEPGYETDTGRFKIGDGGTAWNSLLYSPAEHESIPASLTGDCYFPNGGGDGLTTTANFGAVGRAYLAPLIVRKQSFTSLTCKFNITTAVSGKHAHAVLLQTNYDGSINTTPVAVSGEADCGSTGVKTVTITYAGRGPRLYWLALQGDDTGVAFTTIGNASSAMGGFFGLASDFSGYFLGASYDNTYGSPLGATGVITQTKAAHVMPVFIVTPNS